MLELNYDCGINDIISSSYHTKKKGIVLGLISEFVNQNEKGIVEVKWKNDYKSSASCYATVLPVIKASKLPVRVATRKNRVFLVKEQVWKMLYA